MAFCRLVFPLLVLSVVQSYASVQVPVFLWGDLAKTSLKSNPLVKTSVEEFDGVLNKELAAQPFTVIFIEETLSVEDFSRKNVEGSSSYPYLHSNIDDSVYMPSVENPLRVLNKLADPEKVDHVKLTENGLSAEIEPESGKFLFINLKDAREGESREELLRRHNDFMEDMFTKLQERYDKVVAIYTAHYPSWTISHSRVRRQAVTQDTSDWVMEGLRMYTKTILLNGVDIKIGNLVQSSSSLGNYDMNTTLSLTDYNLELHFLSRGGYWLFNRITLTQNSTSTNENLQAVEELYAPLGFSYRCGQNVTFTTFNETKQFTLLFQNLKIQPYFNSTLNITDLQFGDSYNCVGFFSIPIWAGLFVVCILLSITFYGIMMMMDIRTMDRFDDPKGKTITINTVE